MSDGGTIPPIVGIPDNEFQPPPHPDCFQNVHTDSKANHTEKLDTALFEHMECWDVVEITKPSSVSYHL